MLEHESVRGVVESMKVVTASNSERVARFGFEFARRNGRKKVCGTFLKKKCRASSTGVARGVLRVEPPPNLPHCVGSVCPLDPAGLCRGPTTLTFCFAPCVFPSVN